MSEISDKIISASAGNTANRKVALPGGSLDDFMKSTVPAARIEPHWLISLCIFPGHLSSMTRIFRHTDFVFYLKFSGRIQNPGDQLK